MANMRIRQLGDPILRQVASAVAVNQIPSDEINSIIAQMATILDGIKAISNQNGNAISAPQIGHSVRIIMLRIDEELMTLINPELKVFSDKKFTFEEECFSFYHLRGVVERYSDVEVDYLDQSGKPITRKFSNDYAALVQHEIDHLDGLFFIDRISDPALIRSIDFDLYNNATRLNQVRNMISYMTGLSS